MYTSLFLHLSLHLLLSFSTSTRHLLVLFLNFTCTIHHLSIYYTLADSQKSGIRLTYRQRRLLLPSWFTWVTWLFCIGIAIASTVCTILLCQHFQRLRNVLWLQTIFIAFLFCNFVMQPLTVLVKAVIVAIIYRKDPRVSN